MTIMMTATETSPSSSCTHALVKGVEQSILHALAFVLYQLDRGKARYCVGSILQWYGQLHRQLPLFAADSLDKCATSFVALSDAEFTAFWLSLVDPEPRSRSSTPCPQHASTNGAAGGDDCDHRLHIGISPHPYNQLQGNAKEDKTMQDDSQMQDTALVRQLYHQICGHIQRLFGLPVGASAAEKTWHAQTPLTSPDHEYDERRLTSQRRTSLSNGRSGQPAAPFSCDADSVVLETTALLLPSPAATADQPLVDGKQHEPGWAVEYMEQESKVSPEMTQRMHRMMHSSIPLNLFRVGVVYPSVDGDGADIMQNPLLAGGFLGVVSPDSFPPTPITRDLQTRRMHHYTATVLDHATLALQLLDANY